MCGAFDEGLDYSLGMNYKYGFNGFPVDLKKARTYLKAAAENNAEAAAVMALLCLDEGVSEGKPMEDTLAEYIKWLKQASDLGHREATKMLMPLQ